MEIKKLILVLFIFIFPTLVCAATSTFGNSQYSSFNNGAQLTNPSFQDYYSGSDIATFWPQYAAGSQTQCQDNTDFLITIAPEGCSPAVVRSDLLSDQNVPVFCQLIGAKVNPLIKVSSIKSISFKGKYPDEVAGVSFHPARAAIRSYDTLLGSPVVNNLGYVVIILKKQANESASPKFVSGNLTATLAYDAQNAFGTGSAEYYLETVSEADWQEGKGQASFWQGRGILRVIDVNGDKARVGVYTSEDKKLTEFTLRVGETSSLFYFPGFYCNAGIKVKLNNLVGDSDRALLNIDGDDIWVTQGSKLLDGRCTVLSLNLVAGTTGSMKIRCGSSFELSLASALSANIVPTGSPLETINLFNLSNIVYSGKKEDKSAKSYTWNIGYLGASNSFSWTGSREFAVLIGQDTNQIISKDLYSKLAEAAKTVSSVGNKDDAEKFFARKINFNVDQVKIVFAGDVVNTSHIFSGLVNPSKELVSEKSSKLDSSQTSISKEYFDDATSALDELLTTNPSARDAYSTYGEQGIISAMSLIDELSSKGLHDYDSKKIELANKFLELYPESSQASYVREQLRNTIDYDNSKAFNSVYVNNAYHTISLREFYAAPNANKKVSFVLTPAAGASINANNLMEGQRVNISSGDKPNYVEVSDIQPLKVSLDFYNWSDGSYRKSSYSFSYDSFGNRDAQKIKFENVEYNVLITDVDVKKVAYVSLISEIKTHSEANFTFSVGIEKRNIQINPERAQNISDELNKTIQKWEDRNAQLGKLLEKWKAACLVTGLGLQVKNLFGGFTGESLARQEVMKTYKTYCLSNETGSMTKSQCYSSLSQNISNDIDCYQNAMKTVETEIGTQTLEQWKTNNISKIAVSNGVTISTNDFTSFEDVKSYLLNQEIQKCSLASSQLKKSILGTTTNRMYGIYTSRYTYGSSASDAEKLPLAIRESALTIQKDGKTTTIQNAQTIAVSTLRSVIDSTGSGYSKLDVLLTEVGDDKTIEISSIPPSASFSSWRLVLFTKVNSESLNTRAVFNFTTNGEKISNIVEENPANLRASDIVVKPRIGFKCNYNYKDPKVSFYESGTNKGLPAVVPFDKQGWYAYVPNSAGGALSDNVKSYTASGMPSFYYICSVGSNGVMELRGGDDSCFSNNVNTDAGTYGGCALSSTEVQRFRSAAENAIRQAAQQYGKKQISIPGFGSVGVDAPATSDGNLPYECEDFMSVDDCKVMYNVCDPVICPTSRCNFGGQTTVPNVIQSGIIGSLVLCSKNFVGFGGDVFVPFCLTGVHAGIEGYISILKAQRDCMAEAARTGSYTGICDEITAVYKCEFFWRQAAPLMQNLVPNLAEYLYTGGQKGFGQNKGGGEYATFQSAWDNIQKSIDYFKNEYASTSFSAVQFGNVEEIGTQFCRSFVGTSLPTSGSVLDQMLKPESPYQFYAQFSEIPFTEATVPPTSQYKVFYHIYAGTDQGVSYQVYLKNPPSSSYYSNAERVSVKVGYIAAGQQVSETKDMTLPAGYKELCVIVNGKEECGFKSVTTDYGLDSLSAAYTKDQANRSDIKTEKECIQGSTSMYALANLNPQAGVESATQPNIALNGIVRVCATENPGKATNPSRWSEVGTCGTDSIKCWLDQNSVKSAVSEIYQNTGTIASAQDAIKKVNNLQGTMTEEESSALLSNVRANISGVVSKNVKKDSTSSEISGIISPTLQTIDKLISFAYLDLQQAEALLQKYFLYEAVVKRIAEITPTSSGGSTVPVAPVAATTPTNEPSSTKTIFNLDGNNLKINNTDLGYTAIWSGSAGLVKNNANSIVGKIDSRGKFSFDGGITDSNLVGLESCTFQINTNVLTGLKC
jgi:hypothetical protein